MREEIGLIKSRKRRTSPPNTDLNDVCIDNVVPDLGGYDEIKDFVIL